ncbi:MAG: adenylate/guanylate cyclase domain-containing protein [Rhodospirillales bacterium]
MRRRLRDLVPAAALVVAAACVSFFAPRFIPIFAVAEQWLVDLRVTLLSPAEPQRADIVLIVVDETSLAGLPYRSPVDRQFLADLLSNLDAAGARAIGLDLLLDQATEAGKDECLARVMRSLHAPLVVAWADTADLLTERQEAFLGNYVGDLDLGFVTLLTDPYLDVVRWVYPGRPWQGQMIPGFAGALATVVGATPSLEVEPLGYRPGPDADTPAFRTFSAAAVRWLPKEWFAGKIVLIGSDLPHQDRHRTPMATIFDDRDGTLPGVAVHAHALAQLLDGRGAPVIDPTTEVVTVAIVAVAAMLIGALNLSVAVHTVIGVLSFALLWVIGFEIYRSGGILIPLVTPSLAFALTFAAANAFWRGRTRRQSQFIQTAFSRFASPAVVQALIRDPDRLRLGGEKREISCLFTDIADFTPWLERAEPEAAVATLSVYLNEMCRITFEHDGTLDKLVGDAVHVLFGAPVEQPDHAQRAVRCAIAMDAFARAFAARQRAHGAPFGNTRIGVHCGTAVVGNFGGERFFDYTAYGDTVNTTARLESANKYLGTLICVSAAAVAACPGMVFRPVGSLVVIGRSQPIDVFEPVLPGSSAATSLPLYLDAFARLARHDAGSDAVFVELHQQYSDDPLIRLHAERSARGELGVVLRIPGK